MILAFLKESDLILSEDIIEIIIDKVCFVSFSPPQHSSYTHNIIFMHHAKF